jgi:hypothetical protein
MTFTLLLADSHDPLGAARAVPVKIQVLHTSPGGEDVTVSFRPNRTDDLYLSAKFAAQLAYGILFREGIFRSQLVIRLRLGGEAPPNVIGRSADLLLTLAMIVQAYEENGQGASPARACRSIAATGVLGPDGTVAAVDRLASKLEAACAALDGAPGTIFFPIDNLSEVDLAALSQRYPHLQLRAIGHLDQALDDLGIALERVYLRNPFRGLEYFDYEHRAIFFGRDAEIREVVEQLMRREAMQAAGVLVEGASGSGKSSFLRAGLLPALVNPASQAAEVAEALGHRPVRESVRKAIWRVGHLSRSAVEEQVVQSILECWRVLPEFAGRLPATCPSLSVLADERQRHWPAEQRFVWLIDQFEELFALSLESSVIEAFGRFLLRLQSDCAWTVACIRADALAQLKQHAELRQVFGSNEGQYYLQTMAGAALDDALSRPAKAAGLTFGNSPSGKPLDQVLREELYATRENALPLLQFTLYELYQRRSGTQLQYETYEQLGGLSGSVATAAEAALQADSASNRALPRIFRSLVTVGDDGRPFKRLAPLEEIPKESAERRLLGSLVSARLCITDEHDGSAVVGFAHEALLRTWPRLADWLKDEASLLKARELAERECRLWEERHRSSDWLAGRDKLALFAPLAAAGLPLPGGVAEFIALSERRVRRLTAIKSAAITAIVLLALLASTMGWEASRKAREAEHQARQASRAQMRAETEAQTARATVEFLSTIFDAPTPENSLGRMITARELLDAGARRLNATLVSAPDVKARLTERIGKAYRELGEYERAAPLLESAVAQDAALPDVLPEDRAEAHTEAARLYDATDRHDRARTMLIEAARWEEQVPSDRRSAEPYILRAEIETSAADFKASKAALDRASAILAARHQANDKENYELPLHYSRFYLEQGKFIDSERFGVQAIDAQRRIAGEEDPTAIAVNLNMQNLYLWMQAPARAEPFVHRARDIARSIYGPQHPRYAEVLMNYADVLGAMGRPKEAEPLLREALGIRLKTLGPNHTSTGYSYYNLGNAIADQGRNAEALPLIVRSQLIWEISEGREHPDIAWALDMQARLLTALGRGAEAIPLAIRAREISEKAYSPEHPNVGRSWMRLGDAYLETGKAQASVAAYQHALRIFETAYGPNGPRVGEVLEKYSKALRTAGRTNEASAIRARARQILKLDAPSD